VKFWRGENNPPLVPCYFTYGDGGDPCAIYELLYAALFDFILAKKTTYLKIGIFIS